jgi:competence protein ComEA
LFIWIAVACIAATVYAITVNLGGPITVDIAGAVVSPAVYELERGSRVHEAIEAAGGLAEDADAGYLNRAAVLHDGDRLYVPAKEASGSGALPQDTEGSPSDSSEGNGSGAPPSDSTVSSGGSSDASVSRPVNINTADAGTLQTLQDIGPVIAEKIIDYRNKNGPFTEIEDIKNVDGIGEKTFEKLKNNIRVR